MSGNIGDQKFKNKLITWYEYNKKNIFGYMAMVMMAFFSKKCATLRYDNKTSRVVTASACSNNLNKMAFY